MRPFALLPVMTYSFDLLASLTSFGLLFCLFKFYKPRPRLSLPPGPKKLPIIGNALDVNRTKDEWVTYQKWSQEYSASCGFYPFVLVLLGRRLRCHTSQRPGAQHRHSQLRRSS
jgi:hypothetical protein